MRKSQFWGCLAILLSLAACSDETQPQQNESAAISVPDFAKETFSIGKEELEQPCKVNSDMVCAVNLFIKCSINSQMAECQQSKERLPSFVFMQDESLERPTQVTYNITKLKPLSGGVVEVYTRSQCDGKWFGLCNGNIIYVMKPDGQSWAVQDVYATESAE